MDAEILSWMLVALLLAFVGMVQHLRLSYQRDVLRHKVRLLETDLAVARSILRRRPDDTVEYARRVIAAIEESANEMAAGRKL